jgi:hypothetical protein
MKSVFFYGLFMDKDLLSEKGLNPKNVRQACLTGFGLRIGERATLEQSQEECSYGTVIELESNEVESLYSGESVADYVPYPMKITDSNGETIDAISYILPMEKVSGTNSTYAGNLTVIAKKLGLPEDYIKEIEGWI